MKLFWNEEIIKELEAKIEALEQRIKELEEASKADNKDWLSRL